MSTFLADMKKFDEDVGNLARQYLDMQITCMLLHHAGCIKLEEGDVQRSTIIIDSVRQMRDSVDNLYKTCINSFSEAGFRKTLARINYQEQLYVAVSDDVLKSNAACFNLAPRPQGAAYVCDIATCNTNMEILLQKYFSPLWGQ